MNFTFGQLIDFILEYRKDKVFTNLSKEQVAFMVKKAVDAGTLYYATDGHKITGMILARKDDEKKILFIIENLALTIKNLRTFAKKAAVDFPGYGFEGIRHKRHAKFNDQKFIKTIEKL